MKKNLLFRTKTYFIGNLEFTDDWCSWRDSLSKHLSKIGIICLDPTKECFVNQIFESQDAQERLKSARSIGNLAFVKHYMKEVIRKDLRMVDVSDFLIFRITPDKPTFGSVHEFVHGCHARKPILILIEDKKTIPLWIAGLVDINLIFETEDELVKYLLDVDSGRQEIDHKYWKLFSEEYR